MIGQEITIPTIIMINKDSFALDTISINESDKGALYLALLASE